MTLYKTNIMETKVTEQDLIGELEGFPFEIVEKMLAYQFEQVGKKDISVFQKQIDSDIQINGFRWSDTIEGYEFWNDVINGKNFDLFFKRYPKLSKNVYIFGDEKLHENVIKSLERRGGINEVKYLGNYDDCIYYINPKTNCIEICTRYERKLYDVITSVFEKIEPDKFIEMTLSEIADKLGVDVDLLRIKK